MKTIDRQTLALKNLLDTEVVPESFDDFPDEITLPMVIIGAAVRLAAQTAKDLRVRTARLNYNGQEWKSRGDHRGPPYHVYAKHGMHLSRPHFLGEFRSYFFRPMIHLYTELPTTWPDTQTQIGDAPAKRRASLLLSPAPRNPVNYPEACPPMPSSGDIKYFMQGVGGTLGVLHSVAGSLCMLVRKEPDPDTVFSGANLHDRERLAEAMEVLNQTSEQASGLDTKAVQGIMLGGMARAVQELFACYFTDNPMEGKMQRIPPSVSI